MAKLDEFQATFETLRKMLAPYAKYYPAVVDEPRRYFLASKASTTRSGAAMWFGGVEIRKNYVTFHFIPMYAEPSLLKHVSPSLLKRKQGKGCFSFVTIEPAQLKELAALTKKGFAAFATRFP